LYTCTTKSRFRCFFTLFAKWKHIRIVLHARTQFGNTMKRHHMSSANRKLGVSIDILIVTLVKLIESTEIKAQLAWQITSVSCYVHPALLLGHPANSEVAKLPFSNSSSGRRFFSETFRKTSFRKLSGRTFFRKKNLWFLEVLRNYFRKNVIRDVSGRSFFWKISIFFRKKVLPEVSFFKKYILFCNNLLLMDKLNCKIINIIIHK